MEYVFSFSFVNSSPSKGNGNRSRSRKNFCKCGVEPERRSREKCVPDSIKLMPLCYLRNNLSKPTPKVVTATGILQKTGKPTKKFVSFLHERYKDLKDTRLRIMQQDGSLMEFAAAYEVMGIRRVKDAIEFFDWAPDAMSCSLVGDFNAWMPRKNRAGEAYFGRDDYGRWCIIVHDITREGWELERLEEQEWFRNNEPNPAQSLPVDFIYGRNRAIKPTAERKQIPGIPHLGRYRVHFHTEDGPVERVPAWASYVLPDSDGETMSAVFWDPPVEEKHQWRHKRPSIPKSLRIYECHIGMSGEELQISSYKEFTGQVLPYIKKAGYNVVQLMGVQEHADYTTFGYKVNNMYAVSSRFGTPEDFKNLVDTAHGLGLLVFMDIVHSHFSPDEVNGLSNYDGWNDCYFHHGRRRRHIRWGTRMFKYGDYEVLRFLLSNLRWWVNEYGIDGYNFHSIPAMVYTHNGFAHMTGDLDEYCDRYVNRDALVYLILANEMLHTLSTPVITIAEDTTLYPGLCEPTKEGGLGFDYYVNTAPSEMWLWLIENIPVADWSMQKIADSLLSVSKLNAKALVFAENHSQSISGGKSLAQALLEKNEGALTDESSTMPLLKMIKLLTVSFEGSAYLNFMGNEFSHPGWLEAPSNTNKYSFSNARRQWSLLQNKWHASAAAFDKALMNLEQQHQLLSNCPPVTLLKVDDFCQVLVYTRGNLVFVCNFRTNKTYRNYKILVDEVGEYEVLLDTDKVEFGGFGRLSKSCERPIVASNTMMVSLELPPLSAQVYKLSKVWDCSMQNQKIL